MRSLGLYNAKDTIVGDNNVRGVSGGERRRVTLGEMMCGPQTVFLLDSVSTGLDSSTTFDIMSTLKVCMCWTLDAPGVGFGVVSFRWGCFVSSGDVSFRAGLLILLAVSLLSMRSFPTRRSYFKCRQNKHLYSTFTIELYWVLVNVGA